MTDSNFMQERVTLTLTVQEWSKVGAGLVALYGPGDETLNKIRYAIGVGN